MQRATVTHVPTGTTWNVETPTHRPNAQRRQALRVMQAGPVRDGLIPCAGCGIMVGVTATVADTPNGTVAVAAGEADRIVRDHPAFAVTGSLGYSERTVANVCPTCNGSDGRREHFEDLENVALRLLQRP